MADKKFHIELFQNKSKGKQRWNWRYWYNDEIIAVSGETYLSTSINSAVFRLRKNIHSYKTEQFFGKNGLLYWHLKARNGKIVAASPKGYKGASTCNVKMDQFRDTIRKAQWVKKFRDKRFKSDKVYTIKESK